MTTGRNDPCPCGSGKKFKHCCGAVLGAAEHQTSTPVTKPGDPDEIGRLVGLVHYLFHRSTTTIAPFCYLRDLFTDASQRGKGVGKALIEAVYEQARLSRAPRVYWHTHETNRTAMRLYDQVAQRSGFVVYSKDI